MNAALAALAPVIGTRRACQVVGVARSSHYRRQRRPPTALAQPRRSAAPPRALSLAEREAVRAVLESERFQDAAPREVYATLLDEGTYLCSWRTMYRILTAHDEVRERRNQCRHPMYEKPVLCARGPNQGWSWDITKLKGPQPWTCYYAYVVLDIFSRAIVGWMVMEQETAELAEELLAACCWQEGIGRDQLTIHADRGSSMMSKTVAQLLSDLGVVKSHSRPHVSNDNPYSEAQFKTLKYQGSYPARFGSLDAARRWMRSFVAWYNHAHHHTGLALMTPAQVHGGAVAQIHTARQTVLDAAYVSHPDRFVRGLPSAGRPPSEVWINQPTGILPLIEAPGAAGSGTAAADQVELERCGGEKLP